jgi:hypothetical protein
MRALIFCLTCCVVACVSGSRLEAQALRCQSPGRLGANSADYAADDGPGGFFDWLLHLSGPQFIGGGGSWAFPLPGCTPITRIEPAVSFRRSFDSPDKIEPNTNIDMVSLQVLFVVLPRSVPFNFGAGLAVHRFSGRGFDDVIQPSFIPLQIDWRVPIRSRHILPRIGFTAHVFPAFGASDFSPLDVHVRTKGAELTGMLKLSADYR